MLIYVGVLIGLRKRIIIIIVTFAAVRTCVSVALCQNILIGHYYSICDSYLINISSSVFPIEYKNVKKSELCLSFLYKFVINDNDAQLIFHVSLNAYTSVASFWAFIECVYIFPNRNYANLAKLRCPLCFFECGNLLL